MSACLSMCYLIRKFQKRSQERDMLYQLVHTLGSSLCEAFHVGKRSVALRRPVPELSGHRRTHNKDSLVHKLGGW